jgi:hypothetical protein
VTWLQMNSLPDLHRFRFTALGRLAIYRGFSRVGCSPHTPTWSTSIGPRLRRIREKRRGVMEAGAAGIDKPMQAYQINLD